MGAIADLLGFVFPGGLVALALVSFFAGGDPGTTRSTIISMRPSHRESLPRTVSAKADSSAARAIQVRFFADCSMFFLTHVAPRNFGQVQIMP